MSAEVAERLAGSIAEQGGDYPVDVIWHGGEPLTTPVTHMTSLLAAFEPLRRDGHVLHGVQTNATLITEAWCDLLIEYGFQVGVGIDGPNTLNAARVDRAGAATFDKTMAGINMLRRAGIPFTVICVVTPASIGHADDLVSFFQDLGCAGVGFNLEEQEGLNAHRAPISVETPSVSGVGCGSCASSWVLFDNA
jgi:uncharacterized protein